MRMLILELLFMYIELKTAGYVHERCFASGRIRGTTVSNDTVLCVSEVGVHFG
jgi:hypothetical protein